MRKGIPGYSTLKLGLAAEKKVKAAFSKMIQNKPVIYGKSSFCAIQSQAEEIKKLKIKIE